MKHLNELFEKFTQNAGLDPNEFSYKNPLTKLTEKDKIIKVLKKEITLLENRKNTVIQYKPGKKIKEIRFWKVVGDHCYINVKYKGKIFPKNNKYKFAAIVDNNKEDILNALRDLLDAYNKIDSNDEFWNVSEVTKISQPEPSPSTLIEMNIDDDPFLTYREYHKGTKAGDKGIEVYEFFKTRIPFGEKSIYKYVEHSPYNDGKIAAYRKSFWDLYYQEYPERYPNTINQIKNRLSELIDQ
jgi:hypothetical protein